MDYAEQEAAAETELRDAILSKFLKPETPFVPCEGHGLLHSQ
jgi:hypothetical protein